MTDAELDFALLKARLNVAESQLMEIRWRIFCRALAIVGMAAALVTIVAWI